MAGSCLIALCGCRAVGFLASEGPFEGGKDPEYNLQKQQDRKILLWMEFPQSLYISKDIQDRLTAAFKNYMTGYAKIKEENLLIRPSSVDGKVQDPRQVAKQVGAQLVLLVQVDGFELDSLKIREFYTGEIITRAALLDVNLPTAVWPKQPEGKMVHIAVEVETGGREAVISRLVSGASQCTIRYLYPCDKLKFKNSDERVSVQEAFEIETY